MMAEQLLLQQIDAIRKHQPRCGGRKLFIELQPFFAQHQLSMGRDKFFDLLKNNTVNFFQDGSCFYSSVVLADSSVLRNPPERKARNRYHSL